VDVSTLIIGAVVIGAVVGAAAGGLIVYLLSRLKNSDDQRPEVAF
jgi:NhaP-type Na+/H+ or K+/H+ antiporter